MDEIEVILGLLPLLIPVVLIQLALMLVAIVDLVKREYVRGDNKIIWVLIIAFISIVGPVAYFLFGRKENHYDSD